MTRPGVIEVDDALLRGWPLPEPDGAGDKESRGRVLVVAGSREMPGAAILAATAALRAGAGKLVIATPASVAAMVAAAMPEARVVAMPESEGGGMLESGLGLLEPIAGDTACVLVGPGMIDSEATSRFARAMLPLFDGAMLLLDALAMDVLCAIDRFTQPVLLTPHAGEMAHLTRLHKADVAARPLELARQQATAWGAVVALKGARTCIAEPQGRCWQHSARTPGLGTSGSGDVLAGLIAGLCARGTPPEQAAVWGVALHARAGEQQERRSGSVGYLARELAAEVPGLMQSLAA
jgi:ADP-dependent NAD(P)H-hydrate dehydratase